MSEHLDEPGSLRDERLDVDAVAAWLAARVDGLSGPPTVKQYKGGASNLTYLFAWPDRELIVRRPPFGHKAKSAHDMGREVRFLQSLRPVYSGLPEVVGYCDDPTVADGEFYAMERLRGIILRQDLPDLGLDASGVRTLCERVLDKLIELHGIDVDAHGLQHLGKGGDYVRRQIAGWSRRYRAAITPGAPDYERVMTWLHDHQKPDVATTIIHGDFRFDNVVLDPADPLTIVGVLDWEMATLGDPLMDLGNSLAYWVEADDEMAMQLMRRQPTNAPGMLTRDEVWQYYGAATGRDVTFYEVYGLFRLAVILQQIWYRYHYGQTTNPAFAMFGDVVTYLDIRCQRILDERGA
jgi:aminoglycoside phosphotransferase (APT) family kinase protein